MTQGDIGLMAGLDSLRRTAVEIIYDSEHCVVARGYLRGGLGIRFEVAYPHCSRVIPLLEPIDYKKSADACRKIMTEYFPELAAHIDAAALALRTAQSPSRGRQR